MAMRFVLAGVSRGGGGIDESGAAGVGATRRRSVKRVGKRFPGWEKPCASDENCGEDGPGAQRGGIGGSAAD